ncbi:FAD-dependent oxidoreductase [Frigoribacterium sp. VKM Ac-2836]|uniref:flavin monoamine oxidase family protein n=1 Tax=Frigoribacterium sp. VKM Ac-2836 TaxID=2739014 RepID=UPI001564DCD8|nr:FAD-dependent oxidoreductase [Frigoribacterium sp. VKM Ac-2836]NRD25167.1 FAD-dependent oxidoreductase [Frigoribacterium sp. VKM Ac-2836]
MSRRAFLTGSVSGAAILVLSACTTGAPAPTGSPTPAATGTPSPTPTPTPGATVVPAAFRRSSWTDDPYALGATSHLTPGTSDADRRLLGTPLDDRLFFAGEAVAGALGGTVYGARQSGFDVAAQVAEVAGADERIAVIGAGIAGATAARSLADRGYDVVVVEARGRVGGRVHSVHDDDWPYPVELGVGLLGGPDAVALEAALALARVRTRPLDDTVEVRTSDGTVDSLGDAAGRLDQAASWAAARATTSDADTGTSVADALAGSGADQVSTLPGSDGVSDADRLALVLDDLLPARWGAGADDLAVATLGDDPALDLLPTGATLVTGGLSGFVSGLLDGLDVLRDSNVVRVQYGDRGVGLRLATGESLSVDRAVSTIPLGVLKTGVPEFSPELPSTHADAIEALGVGDREVLWLRFDEAFWSTQATVWAVLDEDAPYRLFVNLMPATGAPVLVALTGGDAATEVGALDDDAAVAAAMRSLAPYLDLVAAGSPAPTDGPTPDPTS